MYDMLYYPLVHPPKRTLFEAALYWDSLTSLVPHAYLEGDYHLNEDLARLKDDGFYHPTALEPLMAASTSQRAIDNLELLIDNVDWSDLAIPDQLQSDTRLWSGKLPRILEHSMISRGLLVHDARQPGALRGNPKVLLATMACLAEEASMLLERRTGTRVVPSTDNRHAHACTTIPLGAGDARLSWMVDVGRLLPVPDSDTLLADVIGFRDAYRDEVIRCRDGARQLFARLRAEINNPNEVIIEFNRDLAEAVDDLRRAGAARFRWRPRQWAWVTVATVASIGGAAVSDSPLPLVAGPAAAIGAVAVNLATTSSRSRDDVFSYLHHLSDAFPLARPVT